VTRLMVMMMMMKLTLNQSPMKTHFWIW